MKLVKFKNGKWGLRKGSFIWGYSFRDFKNGGFWWSQESQHFRDCMTDEDTARDYFNLATDCGEAVE